MRASGAAPHQPGVGDDGACDRGAVRMRPLVGIERVETIRDHAPELGMSEVDAGIDHRDQHLFALGELMRLPQPELGQRILRRVAFADPRGGWRLKKKNSVFWTDKDYSFWADFHARSD
jgi:hypothetical protein